MYDDILEIQNPYDEVAPNLFIGGILNDYRQFDSVICLTPDVAYHNRMSKFTYFMPFPDIRELPSEEFLSRAVQTVHECLRYGSTLVHCSAGCNRSGLIVGLALIEMGYTDPGEAIERMRTIRSCSVLHNEVFEHRVRHPFGRTR